MACAECLAWQGGKGDGGDRMRLALLLIIVGIVIFGPQLWTRRVFAQHSVPRPDYPVKKAHVEHAVCLVKHQRVHSFQIQVATA